MTEKKKRDILWALPLTIIYAAVHLFLISKHEIWRDEAYVWGFVTNGSLSGLLPELSRVGHPCLWFAYLLPFEKLGLPFSMMGLASLIPMAAAVFLLFNSDDIPILARLLGAASSVFLYYNAVIARPYALSVLFIVLLCVFWKNRREKPLRYCLVIALLLQTHVIFAGFCGGLVLELWIACGKKRDEKAGRPGKAFLSSVLPILSAFSLLPQLWQQGDPDVTVSLSAESRLSYITKEHILEGLGSVFQYDPGFLRPVLHLLVAAALLFFAILMFRNREGRFRSVLPAACGIFWFYFCVCLIRPVEHVHMASCLLMHLFFLFITVCTEEKGEKGTAYPVALIFLFVFGASSCYYTLQGAVRDLQGPYSGSLEAARFVIANLPEGSVLGLEERQDTEAPCAYIAEKRSDIRFYNAWKAEDWSYYKWLRFTRPEADELIGNLRESGGKELYYLTRKELPEETEAKLLFRNSRESVWMEDYYLYRIDAQ